MILGVRGGLKREREYSVMYGKIVGGVEVAKYFCLIYSLEPLYRLILIGKQLTANAKITRTIFFFCW